MIIILLVIIGLILAPTIFHLFSILFVALMSVVMTVIFYIFLGFVYLMMIVAFVLAKVRQFCYK